MSASSNDIGSLSLFNVMSNTNRNERTGNNVLLRCPLEALFEIFYAKINVR
jgi:hypothetical protein